MWSERVLSLVVRNSWGETFKFQCLIWEQQAVPLRPWTSPEAHAWRHRHQVQGLLSVTAFLAVPLVLACFLAHLWP